MTTTETIMVATEVEVNPIFDAIVAELSLDPFADMQLVDVDGEIIDAMDRTLPQAWIWELEDHDIQAQIDILATRVARKAMDVLPHAMSQTGAYRMVVSGVQWQLPAGTEAMPVMPAELPAVDPWASKTLAALTEAIRPETLTDTMAVPARSRFQEPTLLGLQDDVDTPPEGV